MTLSVIIITLQRPEELARCLQCLSVQEPLPDQVIVVDSSADELSLRVVDKMREDRVLDVLYLRSHRGNSMTRSRNIGLREAKGDIIAFLDDDAFAHEGWSRELLSTYAADPEVVAVGGRALNSHEGEGEIGVDLVGRLDRNGGLHGYFAADTKESVVVDHLMGCNMSFRRTVLAKLGGFREDYPGISGVREDTDVFMRIRQIKGRVVFNPRAVATHVGAPQASGRRFDLRYEFYNQHNHLVMLINNFGFAAPILRRYLFTGTRRFLRCVPQRIIRRERHPIVVFASVGVYFAATFLGLLSGLKLLKRRGLSPIRHDEQGQKIRDFLMQTPVSAATEK